MGLYYGYISLYGKSSGSPIWFANQGQTLKLTDTRNLTHTVSHTTSVSSSIGVEGKIKIDDLASVKISLGSSVTDSYTESYSISYNSSVCGTYNLSNNKLYKHDSYSFAAYGIICKNKVYKYDKSKTKVYDADMYSYYAAYGSEIRLVYRY